MTTRASGVRGTLQYLTDAQTLTRFPNTMSDSPPSIDASIDEVSHAIYHGIWILTVALE